MHNIGDIPEKDFWQQMQKLFKDYGKTRKYLTVPELAKYISKSSSFIYNNIDSIPHRKQGATLLFVRSEIDKWLDKESNIK